MQDKVTIVTPSWNSERYIEETIKSVQAQTYQNWEMIIVDDCSTDCTIEIIKKIILKDPRVKLMVQPTNMGAAKARTRSMQSGTGRYVAYLDSDDIWKPEKLERQIAFMKEKNCGFSCTSYEVIDDSGNKLNKYIHMLPKVNYIDFLTNNLLQTVGIMVDTQKVDKKYLIMPDIRRRQDAATWLQVLKAGFECYGLDEILAEYRRACLLYTSRKGKPHCTAG